MSHGPPADAARGLRRESHWPRVDVPGHWFGIFRVLFGLYLAVHFLKLLPYAAELFSREGVFPSAAVNPTAPLFPNPLAMWDSPTAVCALLWLLVGCALVFASGKGRRPVALVLWFGWACLFNRNNLIANPSIPYVGLLLLATLLVPPGEAFVLGRRRPDWRFPAAAYWVLWVPLAVGYTYSGIVKLGSPSWVDGSALLHLLNNPLARPGPIRDLLLALPGEVLRLATWSALMIEIAALPLSLWRRGRMIAWGSQVALQVGILTVVAFADLTLGMLMAHLFTFDAGWVRRSER